MGSLKKKLYNLVTEIDDLVQELRYEDVELHDDDSTHATVWVADDDFMKHLETIQTKLEEIHDKMED